ncbi:hypothetical protein F4774DRAFT_158796 [Daldinia eschscholtzii]|nr:hypothetical protein F4774DRAFT_158796 [Daldinia eschscholtzii]
MDQTSFIPLGGAPGNASHQEALRPAQTRDSTATIAALKEQLNAAQREVKNLEKELDSNCDAAEKIVNWLLRERAQLRESLQRSEARIENEARKLRQARETAQLLFEALCESKADLGCNVKCHKEIVDALEESLKATEDAVRKEAERSEEVRALREELRIAHNSASDERQLARVVSQQVEALERLIRVQHDEIKQQKSAIADLKQVNKIPPP